MGDGRFFYNPVFPTHQTSAISAEGIEGEKLLFGLDFYYITDYSYCLLYKDLR